MRTSQKVFIGLVCVILVFLALLTVAGITSNPTGMPAGSIPVNAPPSKGNPRPIDVNTGKYLDQEEPTTHADWPYVNYTGNAT